MDATTCLNDSQRVDDNDNDMCNDVSNYGQPEDDLGDDSGTLPSPKIPSQVIEQSSSSSEIKRPRGDFIAIKRDVRPWSRMTKIGDEINTTLMDLRNELKQPPPPPVIPYLNSDAELWQRLEKMTLTTDQKLIVGTFLS
jgi:hypothetical protein